MLFQEKDKEVTTEPRRKCRIDFLSSTESLKVHHVKAINMDIHILPTRESPLQTFVKV